MMIESGTQQGPSDSVGLIIDRTKSDLVVGQAVLIAKSRVVTLASSVFNYDDFPWALKICFPHANLEMAVKSITIHPDFNKREAQRRYLSQGSMPRQAKVAFSNDLASLAIDQPLVEMSSQQIQQVTHKLSGLLPESQPNLSGTFSDGNLVCTIERVLAKSQQGLLIIFDERNFPVAWLSIRRGLEIFIAKVIYKNLAGELAFFELCLRQRQGSFIFQLEDNFAWPSVRDLECTAEKLIAEANRRVAELPKFMAALGGSDARYVRAVDQYNVDVPVQARWIVERLWTVLDGYITLDKLSERAGADTFTVLLAIQEMLRLQIIVLSQVSPFQGSQLGTPLSPGQPADVKDPNTLCGFYLDPISGRPFYLNGSLKVVENQVVLHNMPFPEEQSLGAIVSGDRLIGLNAGKSSLKTKQVNGAPFQMVSMIELNELTIKRFRPEEVGQMRANSGSNIGRFICAACGAVNVESGVCHKCGADIATGMMPHAAQHAWTAKVGSIINNRAFMIAISIAVVFGALMSIFVKPKPQPANQPAITAAPVEENAKVDPKITQAIELAVKYAGFKPLAPPTYAFESTLDTTGGAPSFGIVSQRQNQRILFVVFDSVQPVDHLDLITKKIPYTEFKPVEDWNPIDKGESQLDDVHFNWVVARYYKPEDKSEMVLVGAFPSPVYNKSIVVIGRPYNADDKIANLDYRTTLWLVETMAAPPSTKMVESATPNTPTLPANEPSPSSTTEQIHEATAEELANYVKQVNQQIRLHYNPPKEMSKNTVVLDFSISETGAIRKLELTQPSQDDFLNRYVVKLVTTAKLPAVPHVPQGEVQMRLTASGAKLNIELQ